MVAPFLVSSCVFLKGNVICVVSQKTQHKTIFDDSPFIPPQAPCVLSSSRSAMAAPCRTSHIGEKRSTSRTETRPPHIQQPDATSNAWDCCADFGDTAPPFEGSITTLSGAPFPASSEPSKRDFESCASADNSRTLEVMLNEAKAVN